ncbi:hypothetical protein NP493_431g02002 [Ridgeia piscesae]|uniref:Uncharacterized protein n=1 Tax=Ridgeia piscesae TaxID=27915 RepID=A0AAD9KZR8_RIDPI|nr:hypothetical protein NP493_431g02002 [Ridgeia piscesae]
MERCVISIRQWIKTNMLKLNNDKTEILIIRPKSAHQHLLPESVRIDNTNVTTYARNLGVTFDCNMSLERHVINISRTAYYHLHSIGRIRRYLEQGHMKQLVHALVISRIDCSNRFLNGLSVAVVEKLQHVQNACARVILIRSKRDHVTPMLLELHWLPVKCLHGLAPAVLSALLSPYCPTRSMWSLTSYYLISPLPELKLANDPSQSSTQDASVYKLLF